MAKLIINTDGSCLNNNSTDMRYRFGGYGVKMEYGLSTKFLGRSLHGTTNQQMELAAVITGLINIKEGYSGEIVIVTDSKYVVEGVKNCARWKAAGWRTRAKKPIANRNLWILLHDLICKFGSKLFFEWNRGHVGTLSNEQCDAIAQYMSNTLAIEKVDYIEAPFYKANAMIFATQLHDWGICINLDFKQIPLEAFNAN